MVLHTALVLFCLSQPRPDTVDISASRSRLKALSDGAGHVLVYDGERPYDAMFYGDGKRLVQLRIIGGGKSGTESWDVRLWDPRIPQLDGNFVSVDMRDSGAEYSLTCGKRKTPFKALGAEELAKLIASATFVPPSWDRLPEKLLRDDAGTYYFVDRLRTEERSDRRDFRLFVGQRGKMKQMPLKDVVDDSEGMVFSTKSGDLRLIFGNGRSENEKPVPDDFKWIEGKSTKRLTDVPLTVPTNGRLVYMDLGVYAGARLGTPCDDLM